jgi:hypothetical protein
MCSGHSTWASCQDRLFLGAVVVFYGILHHLSYYFESTALPSVAFILRCRHSFGEGLYFLWPLKLARNVAAMHFRPHLLWLSFQKRRGRVCCLHGFLLSIVLKLDEAICH